MTATRFIWDEVHDACVMEKTGGSVTTAVYTNEPVKHGNLFSQRRDAVISYYHTDVQGTTRVLSDSFEATTDTSQFTAFGELVASTGTTINPFGYIGVVGYYADAEIGGLYIRARRYMPTLAKWLSPDPLRFATDVNHYRYSANSVLVLIDPSGLRCVPCTHTTNWRGGKWKDLDTIARAGQPFTDAYDAANALVFDFYRAEARAFGLSVPTVDSTGPRITYNRRNATLPLDKAASIAYWPFAIWVHVCEDAEGDCEVELMESWKEEVFKIGVADADWEDDTSDFKKERHEEIPRHAPFKAFDHKPTPREAKMNKPVMIAPSARMICPCCDPEKQKVILLVDIPNIMSRLKKFDTVIPEAEARKLTVIQEFLIYEKGQADPVESVNNTFTIGTDPKGQLIAKP
jgi:RHS repeat-associated protein